MDFLRLFFLAGGVLAAAPNTDTNRVPPFPPFFNLTIPKQTAGLKSPPLVFPSRAVTNAAQLMMIVTNQPALSGPLKPGIYKTAPYSCIVVVPEAHLDDQALVCPPRSVSRMPTISPDLQFIPKKALP